MPARSSGVVSRGLIWRQALLLHGAVDEGRDVGLAEPERADAVGDLDVAAQVDDRLGQRLGPGRERPVAGEQSRGLLVAGRRLRRR